LHADLVPGTSGDLRDVDAAGADVRDRPAVVVGVLRAPALADLDPDRPAGAPLNLLDPVLHVERAGLVIGECKHEGLVADGRAGLVELRGAAAACCEGGGRGEEANCAGLHRAACPAARVRPVRFELIVRGSHRFQLPRGAVE
jgi:hypothetical protein